jgi:hypothetical protein
MGTPRFKAKLDVEFRLVSAAISSGSYPIFDSCP